MQLAEKAVDPFQFLAMILCNHIISDSNMIPVTQDASASAYQIMSSLLLHQEMARVLPSLTSRKKIADVYMSLLVQESLSSTSVSISLYDRISKKRHRVTPRIPSPNSDKRKTGIATWANFLHKKDAFLAFQVVGKLNERKAPVYTVHENLRKMTLYAKKFSNIDKCQLRMLILRYRLPSIHQCVSS
ncbi:hypothetical protein KSP40_PGU003856 [Platanthera guangdongensis]|uniref:Uncharacterized protein n=1 Tax=Platanthera guangdongensis TaxID=2320717 RepID=A0ABR2LNI4_9ASPA